MLKRWVHKAQNNNQIWGSITMKTKKLIEEALSLPVEERVLIADLLLRSLNMPNAATDAKWAEEARRRLQELRSGKVKAIPGDEVFSEVFKRLAE